MFGFSLFSSGLLSLSLSERRLRQYPTILLSLSYHKYFRAVIKTWGLGISLGYYEHGPPLLLKENRKKIEPKETPSCLTTLNKGTSDKDIRNDFTILYVGDPFLGPLREERGGCQNRPSLYADVVGNPREDSHIKVKGMLVGKLNP